MKLGLLDRLLLSEISGYFRSSLLLFTTILVAMQELQPLTSLVVEHHVSLVIAARIFTFSIPYFMALAFPMAMLLAVLLSFGELSAESGIVAMQAAGVSAFRMAVPVMIFGLAVSAAAFAFNEGVTPAATREKNRLSDMVARAGSLGSGPIHLDHAVGDGSRLVLNAKGYDRGTQQIISPIIITTDAAGRPTLVEWAPSGRWTGLTHWTLEKGEWARLPGAPDAYVPRGAFNTQVVNLGFTLEQLLAANQDRNEMTYRQLSAYIRKERSEGKSALEIDPDLVTLRGKISIPLASFVFALVGFPLGVRRQRSGKAVGFALAIAIIFVYYLIYQYASILGGNGAISPLVAAWVPDIVGLAVAIVLIQRTVA